MGTLLTSPYTGLDQKSMLLKTNSIAIGIKLLQRKIYFKKHFSFFYKMVFWKVYKYRVSQKKWHIKKAIYLLYFIIILHKLFVILKLISGNLIPAVHFWLRVTSCQFVRVLTFTRCAQYVHHIGSDIHSTWLQSFQ